jgi:hypothetical protein
MDDLLVEIRNALDSGDVLSAGLAFSELDDRLSAGGKLPDAWRSAHK